MLKNLFYGQQQCTHTGDFSLKCIKKIYSYFVIPIEKAGKG